VHILTVERQKSAKIITFTAQKMCRNTNFAEKKKAISAKRE
jgi:hypothetical protein